MAATSGLYPLEYIRPKKWMGPVCNVENILADASPGPFKKYESITRSSFVPWANEGGRVFARKEYQTPRMATGIMPQNITNPAVEYTERLLPYHPRIKTTSLPTDGPYQFLPRRRKLPKPHPDQGVFYFAPNAPFHRHRATSARAGLPTTSERSILPTAPKSACATNDSEIASRDIMSVTGRDYSRRKWLQGPHGALTVGEFDGGAPMRPDLKINARYFYTLKRQQLVT
ncbi:uncharacterized protein LOC135502347 [Lineus longissimus]|uniref:uncharacterized protein LOC135502347 n=1 Tax=Lineus longissimus TaxID=88925 RepID=UPI002B4E0353